MIRAQIHISQHVRGRPYEAEYERVHSMLAAAREKDRKFEAAVAIMVRDIEWALERELEVR
jgi:hypothetical protein